jgi:GAF domain-containing protein
MKNLLAPAPALPPEQSAALQDAREQALNQIIRGVVVVAIIAVAGFSLTAFVYGTWSLVGVYVVLLMGLLALAALRRLPYRWRGSLFVALLYAVAVIATVNVGLGGAARLFFVAFAVLATTIFGLRAGLTAAALSVVTWLALAVGFGFFGFQPAAPNHDAVFIDWVSAAASMVLVMVALIIPQRQFWDARLRAAATGQEMAELQETRARLAEQARTLEQASREAEQANRRLEEQTSLHERRAALLTVSAEVAAVAASQHDLGDLLHTSVQLIATRFDFYHAGLFLLDDAREWAVLRAANSTGGQAMLARGHRLRVGQEGIVGYVTRHSEPRVAQDVGGDAVHRPNPDLPETRSEMAVPVTARATLIGALDVQSTETNAFSPEDVRALQTLAAQLGVAIDNARLFQETQRRLAELQALQQLRPDRAQEEAATRPLAFRYDGLEVKPLPGEADTAAGDDVMQVPLRFGDQDLGVLEIRRPGEAWTGSDQALTHAIAERMAVALESAQLFESTRARAQQLAELSQASLEFSGPQLSTAQVLNGIARTALRLFSAEAVSLWLPAGPSELELAASAGDAAPPQLGDRLRRDEGLAGRALATGRAQREDEALDYAAMRADFRAGLAVPLLWQGQTLGVLELALTHAGGRFTPEDENVALLFAAQAASTLENARLFAETQQRLGELATINTISQALAAQLDRQSLAETVGRKVSQAFGHDAFVALYDARTNMVEMPYFTSDDGERSSLPPFPLGQGLTSHVIGTRQPLLINQDTAERMAQLGALQQGRGAQSWLGVPILVGDEVLGVLSVQDLDQEGLFTESDARLLTTIAANVGVALQNVRLFEQTEQRAEELAAVNRLSQALSSHLDLAALSDLVVDGLCRTFSVDSAYLALYDHDFNRVAIPSRVEAGERLTADAAPLGQDPASLILATRQPLLVNANAAQRFSELGAQVDGRPAASFMGVPVFAGDDVLGALVVQDRLTEGRFGADALRLLTTLAANVGVAVQNARLFEQTEQRAEELAVVNELARAISEQLEPTQVLQTVYQQVQRITPLDGFFVSLYDHASGLQTTPLIYEGGRRSEEGPRPLPARGLIRRVVETGEVVLINRTPEDVDQIALSPEYARGHASQVAASLLYLPLHFGPQVGGVMSVQSFAYNAYGQRQVEVLTAVANHVVVALQNARLFEETERRAEQLATAAEVARAASSVLDPDELIVRAVELIRDRFERSAGVYYAALFLIDDSGRWARLRHATGNAGRVLLERQHKLEVGGNSMVGWSTANRRARIALDVGAEPVRFANPLLPNTRSELALPLIVGEGVLGALDVQSTKSGAFTEADVAVLQTMADQLAVAIQNARLFERTARQARRERLVVDITSKIRAAGDMDGMLRTAVEELRVALGTTRAAVRLGPPPRTTVPANPPAPGATPSEPAAADGRPADAQDALAPRPVDDEAAGRPRGANGAHPNGSKGANGAHPAGG